MQPTPLTPEEIKQAYFEAIKGYTNNFHDIESPVYAPLPIQLAVEKMFLYGKRDGTIRTESISDLSLTYMEIQGLPNDILMLINPFCKVPW